MKNTPLFTIRDDDLNYFSTPEDILWWYEDVFSQNIPVGLAAIPFIIPTGDSFPYITSGLEVREYPIHANTTLTTYVKSNPLIEILQHGCTHETKDNVFEYAATDGLFEKTARGKAELEAAFDTTVCVFVAPHDTIGTHGIRAVEASGMDIIRGRGSKTFLPRSQYVTGLARMVAHKLTHPRTATMPAYPYVLDFGGHKEAYSYRLEAIRTVRQLHAYIDYAEKRRGHVVLVNHVHLRDEKTRENLYEAVRYARERGFAFVCPRELFAQSS